MNDAPKTGDVVVFGQPTSSQLQSGRFIATLYGTGKVRYMLEMCDGSIERIEREFCTVHRGEQGNGRERQ